MKKFPLKTFSFLLLSVLSTTQAYAQWSGNTACSNSRENDCIISGSGGQLSGSGNLTIASGATVNYSGNGHTINVSGTSHITNNGTVSATGSATHAIKVTEWSSGESAGKIDNAGSITANWNAISVEATSGTGTIDITNSGHISTVSGKGIYVQSANVVAKIENTGTITAGTSGSAAGIYIDKAASGSTITSSGTLSGYRGIFNDAALDRIEIRSGSVTGTYRAIEVSAHVNTFEVQSGALVKGPIENGASESFQNYSRTGLAVDTGSIGTLTNRGTIEGSSAIVLVSNARIDTFNNEGIIRSTAQTNTWNSALTLVNYYSGVEIGTLTNESGARIESVRGHGISLEFGTTIEAFINKGVMHVGNDGIRFFYAAGQTSHATIGKIELHSGSEIIAGNVGLNLTIPNSHANIGVIDVQSGALIEAQTGAAIVVGSSTVVSGSGSDFIKIAGTLKSPTSSLINQGSIGASGHSGTVIEISPTAEFEGSDDANILNQGTINGDIVFENSQNASFANPGILNGQLIVKGTGDVTIKDWGVTVVPSDHAPGAQVQTVEINTSESSGGKVNIEHVTINDISNALMGKDIDFSNAFKDSSGQVIELRPSSDAVTVGQLPSSLGFDGTYDPATNIFYTSFNIAQTAGAVVSQTLANQLMRRDFFLESAITEAATGSLYHRRLEGVDGTAFVKPYASSDTFDLKGAQMNGQTQGVMLGLNRFVGRHLLTGFVGYERSEIDSNFRSSLLNLDVQSWYAGFNTAHLLASTPRMDTFIKGSLKASYTTTGIDRRITLNAHTTGADQTVGANSSVIHSSAQPETVAIGMNVQMGVNYKPYAPTQIIPMVGLGYSIGKTSSYQLDRTGLINDAYMPERVMMPYADASLTWFQGWGPTVSTFIGGGLRYILDRTQKTALSYGQLPIEGEYSLPQSFQYMNASMVLHMSARSEVALGYTGVLDSTGHSHNLTAKYELHF